MTIRITVMRTARYDDLIDKFELPQTSPCDMREGQVFETRGSRPEGFCQSAWETLFPFVKGLLEGKSKFYGDWMKDPRSAMISCNDGFRPVTFLVEVEE